MNEDVTHITHGKVSVHVKTSGWGNRYLIVFNVVLLLYHGSLQCSINSKGVKHGLGKEGVHGLDPPPNQLKTDLDCSGFAAYAKYRSP